MATVTDHVSRGRSSPIDGSKQCVVTAVDSGKETITGTLKDGTANSFEIVVANKGVVSLTVTKAPDKTVYIENENFDSTGMVITENYNNSTSVDIADYAIVNGSNLVIGQYSVTISYNGKITTQDIIVNAIAIGTKHTEGNYEYSYGQF